MMRIPYAVADFRELKTKGYYYVDKTMYIPFLESSKAPIFIRPRRFGKSLMVSTLYYYFERSYADEFDAIFEGTWVKAHPTAGRSAHVCLRLDFSTVYVEDLRAVEESFDSQVAMAVNGAFLRNKDVFGEVRVDPRTNAQDNLSFFLDRVRQHGLTAYILVDEYDNFTNQLVLTRREEDYYRMTSSDGFLKNFFKVIKSGLGTGAIASCFCTGVLPVTMDDMSSGFNMADFLTFSKNVVNMCGFTHAEARDYLAAVLQEVDGNQRRFDMIWGKLVDYYDSYRFLPHAEPLFNSTILTYYLMNLVRDGGEEPTEMIDYNVSVDAGWLRLLASRSDVVTDIYQRLVGNGEVTYSSIALHSRFNLVQFFDESNLLANMYHLGMVTLKDDFSMVLPNLTVKSTVMRQLDEALNVSADDEETILTFRDFLLGDGDLCRVLDFFGKHYLGQFPAQVFDKVNENFVRCSFFALLGNHLRKYYSFSVEKELPSGRADFVMDGIHGKMAEGDCRVVEFKYFRHKDKRLFDSIREPEAEAVAQARRYAADLVVSKKVEAVKAYVCYVCGNKGIKPYMV